MFKINDGTGTNYTISKDVIKGSESQWGHPLKGCCQRQKRSPVQEKKFFSGLAYDNHRHRYHYRYFFLFRCQPLLHQSPIRIKAVVILSLDDYHAFEETAYLLRNPQGAKRLLESVEELRAGGGQIRELSE